MTASEYQRAADGFERSNHFLIIPNLSTQGNCRKSWYYGILNVDALFESSVFVASYEQIEKTWVPMYRILDYNNKIKFKKRG